MSFAEFFVRAGIYEIENILTEASMRTGNEIFFFFLGISVGVVAALLTAPYTGEEARRYLRERVDEGRERAGEVFEKGKEFVGRQSDTISNAVEQGRKNHPEGI
jgi:gas vesicle protein